VDADLKDTSSVTGASARPELRRLKPTDSAAFLSRLNPRPTKLSGYQAAYEELPFGCE
jgi:hypothetical protein